MKEPIFKIKLTPAQHSLFSATIRHHISIGDCTEHGYTLSFTDLEGARAFRNAIQSLFPSPTTRQYISIEAVCKQLQRGVVTYLEQTPYPPAVLEAISEAMRQPTKRSIH